MTVLRVESVTKRYRGGVLANDGVSLDVAAGDVVGVLGHNGAGKTTLLNQIVGLTRPTSGAIAIDGTDVVANPAHARRACSLQPQSHAPLDGVTPRQAIELIARIRGASRRRARQRTAELLAGLDLEPWAATRGERLSGGVRRLTAFCLAAAEPGRILMLDEPTNDVDPVRRRLLWRQIRAVADAGAAVLLVTHGVVEAERAVDRIVILHNGRVVSDGTPAELRGSHDSRLRLELHAMSDAVAERLSPPFTAGGPPAVSGRRVVVTIDASEAAAAIGWAQRERAAGTVDEFAVNPASLEDVYIGLLGGRTEADRAA
ncbi:ABC transporter ATP-binding protein [Phytohabitans suffuscus]|uniref:Multidrug ABC transporter ATP-binding protein n=1 Tax=Phytohabitans suffuscus TaxID=624315 RepID=A0A6F8YVB2_9ACTN|nr:ABC transporter ATP-binding protein [Phytohabitans suffuscus]BCB89996.1 multidrug ABC transporter ATP-binding protein [Phytohabitans suffuscus]